MSWPGRPRRGPAMAGGPGEGGGQAAGGGQDAGDFGGGGAGGGAELVGDHRARASQRRAKGTSAGSEREQGERLIAFGQGGGRAGGQVLHGGDAGDGLDGHAGDQGADGLGQVAERRVQVGVADRAEGHQVGAVGEGPGDLGRRGLPGGGAAGG